MQTFPAPGISLAVKKYRGTERLVVFYTQERGRIEALAQGIGIMTSLVVGVILMLASNSEGTAEGPSVARPDPDGIIEWGRRIYADGMHNAWPDG